jgi:hypothetical protein
MEGTGQGTPPGWYPDPEVAGGQRYWDGSAWTENRTPGTVVQPAPVAVAQVPTNGKAIASMVLGILCLCGIGSILALVFGYGAKGEIEASNGTQGGGGMATAGIVLGWVGIAIVLAYVLFWVIIGGSALFLGGGSSS